MIKKIMMENLICSSCAGKIESALKELPYINNATFNFPNQMMLIDVNDQYHEDTAIKEITKIVNSIENGVSTYLPHQKKIEINKTKFLNSFLVGLTIIFLAIVSKAYISEYVYISLRWAGYILVSKNIILKTFKGILRKDYFNENTLMVIATFVAMLLNVYNEAILVVLFYTFGEFLQNQAVKKSRSEIKGLVDLKIEYANIEIDNRIEIITPEEIKIGDTIVVKSGEKIPVDGIVIEGNTSINTSALTGESKLTYVDINDEILSGNINVGNLIKIKAKKLYKDSTVSKIIDLIENSTNNKAGPENFITKFARIYTPTVAILALLMFTIPTLINPDGMSEYLYRAAIFLIISCPCALVLSVPLTYFSGIGASARNGILFKGSSYLDMMSKVDMIAIDKTGTLTKGNFTVTNYTNEQTLQIAASVEALSNHPIANSIVSYYKGSVLDVTNITEVSGKGMIGEIAGEKVYVGNQKLLDAYHIPNNVENNDTTSVLVAKGKTYLGQIIIEDEIRETTKEAIKALGNIKITMLTGDNDTIAKNIANELAIDYLSELLPADKIKEYNNLQSEEYKMFVGDGINDAPLLKNADIGVAMGQGSEIAIDVADVIIMNNDLRKLSLARRISLKTKKIVYQNIALTISLKFLVVTLAAFGLSSMLAAIMADVGVSLIAVLNSLRIIYSKEFRVENKKEINQTVNFFKLCSNITIYSILELLSSEDYQLDELYRLTKYPLKTINKKIKLLKKENIISEKIINGKAIYYLSDNNIKDLLKVIKHNMTYTY